MNTLLNRLVRAYLRHSPVTEGKSFLLRVTREHILPSDPLQETDTKWGFSLRLNLGNPEHERIYFYGEHDERYEIACLRKLIVPGMVCWDIGANIGFYTCFYSRLVGLTGKVVSFEPLSATRKTLEGNVKLNAMTNVEIIPMAAGAADGEARIYFDNAEMGEGTASMYRSNGRSRHEQISVCRLDTISPTLPAPDFIKIDVEGAQEDVWAGGEVFFSGSAALVMAELRESTELSRLRRLESRIQALGYRFFEMKKGGRLRETLDFPMSERRNFLLAKPGTEAMRRIEVIILR